MLVVFLPMMFGNKDAAAVVATLPMVLGALAGINATVLPILGIASWFRGKAQADPIIPTNNTTANCVLLSSPLVPQRALKITEKTNV